MSRKLRNALLSSGALIAGCLAATPSLAASHREAPMISKDPTADNTDTYAFVSYDRQNLNRNPAERRVTFIANVIPGEDASDGPNYFEFDPRVLYRINIDNNQDGVAGDVVYEFQFQTETRSVGAQFPLPYLGNPKIAAPTLQGITALDGRDRRD
jgi:hypothetical protein